MTVQVDHGWSAQHQNGKVYGAAEKLAFWNWYYGPKYEAPDACDYSRNCHGFAFDVGDHPAEVSVLMDTNGNPPCWQVAENDQASTVAVAGIDHSIKVSWHKCGKHWTIAKSEEQFMFSGTYSRMHECGRPVLNIWEVHSGQKTRLVPAVSENRACYRRYK